MVDEINLLNVGKRFNGRWLFRNVQNNWIKGDRVAVVGANGSGKSSLSSILAGYLTPTEGSVVLKDNGQLVQADEHWKHVSWTSPALQLPEQLSYMELFSQVKKLRGFRADWSIEKMESLMGLEKHRNQPIKSFSSGMRQRVKLVLSFALSADVLILDEPTAHLDSRGVDWYAQLVQQSNHAFIVVASNSNSEEIFFCNKELDVTACVPV